MDIKEIHKLFLKSKGVCTDTRNIVNNSIYFALKGSNFNGNTFAKQAIDKGAKYAVIDDTKYQNVPNTILVDNVLNALQKLATYHRSYLGLKIIALTGSNGKTTTKELINKVLSRKYKTVATKGNLNNHIGVPLTLLSMTYETEIGIVEMGANHQKEISFLCDIALPDFGFITNFGKAHLEGFGGVEGVIKGKSEMYDHLIKHHKMIFVNVDDPIQVEKTKTANTITFSSSSKTKAETLIEYITSNPYVEVSSHDVIIKSQLIGAYNFNNIAAAIAMGHYFDVPIKDIQWAIENYIPDNNRSQIIQKNSCKIILDAYNANPTSMEAALRHFNNQPHNNKTVILGDMFELGKDAEKEHQAIIQLALGLSFNTVIFIGENFYKNKTETLPAKFYKTFQDYKEEFNTNLLNNSLVLIKGSRGMALERVLELL